jgi:hypothetical protein
MISSPIPPVVCRWRCSVYAAVIGPVASVTGAFSGTRLIRRITRAGIGRKVSLAILSVRVTAENHGLSELDAKRGSGRNLGFFALRKENSGDSNPGSGYAAEDGSLPSTGNPTQHGADRPSASYKDGAVSLIARYLTFLVDASLGLGILRRESADHPGAEAVRKNQFVEVDCNCPGLAHPFGRRYFGDPAFDDGAGWNDLSSVDMYRDGHSCSKSIAYPGGL